MKSSCSRRSFVRHLAMICWAFPFVVRAQGSPQRRTMRIGFLGGGEPTLVRAFEDEMRNLGYVDGQNIFIEKRILLATSTPAEFAAQVADLTQMDLELIVAGWLGAALEVRKKNPAIPMVIATAPGLISNGFAQSTERPGGIYTGIDELPPGVTAKRLRLLKTAAPRTSRVALLSTTPGNGGHEIQVADAEQAARSLRIKVKAYKASTPRELETALASIEMEGMNGILNFQGGLSLRNRDVIIDFAARNRIPAIYQSAFFPESGGLMSWAPNQEEQYREAARYTDKILKGARPGELPLSYPRGYTLTINSATARKLGLKLPRTLLAQAGRVLP